VIQVDDDDVPVGSESFSALTMDKGAPRYAVSFVNDGSRLIHLDDVSVPVAGAAGFSQGRRPISTNTAGGDPSLGAQLRAIVDDVNHGGLFEMSIDGGPFHLYDITAANFQDDEADVITAIEGAVTPDLPAGAAVNVTWESVDGNFKVLQFTSDTANKTSVQIRSSGTKDLAGPLMLGVDQGGIEQSIFSGLRPVPTATVLRGNLNDLAKLAQNAFNQVTLSGLSGNPQPIDLKAADNSPLLETTGTATDMWFKDGATVTITGNNDGVREKLLLLAQELNRHPAPVPAGQQFRAEVWGYHLALIPTSGGANATINITSAADAAFGNLFKPNNRQYALGGPKLSDYQDATMKKGTDGTPPEFSDYVGDELNGTGFHTLDSVDLFNLMVLPADTAIDEPTYLQLAARGSIYCSEHRAFMLVDAPTSWRDSKTFRPTVGANEVNKLRALFVKQNSAVYFPRILVNDRGRRKYMGASGAVAGVMARIDATRGVWKAPAGTEADVRGILDLEVNLSDREQGILNKVGANALRKFPSGFVVWGARTLAGTDDDPNEWKYVPIRRFALFLEESLYRGTRWIVFEPNDEPLWANIRKNIRAFMLGLFRQGAFQGSTPDQAFFVKCDQETTTATDRLLGIVNIDVGFAPLKPAEFVVIRIQQIADQVE
jgi:hypothetical protein